jgi:hypothetical protein
MQLDLHLIDELTPDDRIGLWCHRGGRIVVPAAEVRTAWANRASVYTVRVRHA